MRILAIGDIHGDLHRLAWVLLRTEQLQFDFDLVTLSGDIGIDALPGNGRSPSEMELAVHGVSVGAVIGMIESFLRARAKQAARSEIKVLFVPGNHDSRDLASSEVSINVDVRSSKSVAPFVHGRTGMRIFGLGGSTPTGGDGRKCFQNEWYDDDPEVVAAVKRIEGGARSVLLSHVPPSTTFLDHGLTLDNHVCGSRIVSELLRTAGGFSLVITGHVHERECMRPDVVYGVPVLNAGGLYWPEAIHYRDKHDLSAVDSIMTTRFFFVELDEVSGRLRMQRQGGIALSKCELAAETYVVEEGHVYLEHEDGLREELPTTDMVRRLRHERIAGIHQHKDGHVT